MKNDTIVAISTPKGVGGMAVVRLSGPQSTALALCHLSLESFRPRHSHFAGFKANGALLDEVVATWFPSPHSYTGEDVVELSCHGSIYVQQAVLQALVNSGARLAEPGEFTQRAFLNGRLNLSQAEAVADLIHSVTPAQHRLAISQLRGGYAEKLKSLRQQLLDLTSLLELELDFSQEDVEFADRKKLSALVGNIAAEVKTLLHSFQLGNALKNGIPVAIVGRPNAGKSSLLNALLSDDRAIVSPIPGTTRDTIEELLTIDGITFRIIDTAGLRHSDDPIESLGFERSMKAVRQASVVLFVRDATECADTDPSGDLDIIFKDIPREGKMVFVVQNKADLLQPPYPQGVAVSARTGFGIDNLKQSIVEAVRQRMTEADGAMLANLRHYEALCRVEAALGEVSKGLDAMLPSDLVAVDLRDALYHLGTITGEVTNNEVLGNIFSRFCIGK